MFSTNPEDRNAKVCYDYYLVDKIRYDDDDRVVRRLRL